jgi:hypothetical protein
MPSGWQPVFFTAGVAVSLAAGLALERLAEHAGFPEARLRLGGSRSTAG